MILFLLFSPQFFLTRKMRLSSSFLVRKLTNYFFSRWKKKKLGAHKQQLLIHLAQLFLPFALAFYDFFVQKSLNLTRNFPFLCSHFHDDEKEETRERETKSVNETHLGFQFQLYSFEDKKVFLSRNSSLLFMEA
jgi:fatty acid desaturase